MLIGTSQVHTAHHYFCSAVFLADEPQSCQLLQNAGLPDPRNSGFLKDDFTPFDITSEMNFFWGGRRMAELQNNIF